MHELRRFLIPLLAFALIAAVSFSDLEPEMVIYVQCVISIGIYLWIVTSWTSSASKMLDAYILFATAVFLFNAGQTILYCFRSIDGLLEGRFSDLTIIDTLTMVNFYLVAMHLGASFIKPRRRNRPVSSPMSPAQGPARACATYVGWIFLAISFPFAIYQFWQVFNSVYSQGYFAGVYQGTENVGAEAAPMILGEFIIPGTMFLLAGSRRNLIHRWIALFLTSAYVLIQFFLGFRGMAIVVAAGTAWLWNKTIRKLPVGLILLAVIPLSVLLPFIAKTRNATGTERLRADSVRDAYVQLDNPVLDLLKEMGESMSVNADIIELVPGARPFDAGRGYVYGASALVPNIFWPGVHPAALNSPSRWLIEQVDPAIAEEGGSHGFTLFAEAYMNFGLIGGAIVIMLIGAALAMASRWTDRLGDPGSNAFFAVALCFMLVYARAEFANVVRGVAWYAGFSYLLYRTMLFQVQRSAVPSEAAGNRLAAGGKSRHNSRRVVSWIADRSPSLGAIGSEE